MGEYKSVGIYASVYICITIYILHILILKCQDLSVIQNPEAMNERVRSLTSKSAYINSFC